MKFIEFDTNQLFNKEDVSYLIDVNEGNSIHSIILGLKSGKELKEPRLSALEASRRFKELQLKVEE
jgi:hypothetical protein